MGKVGRLKGGGREGEETGKVNVRVRVRGGDGVGKGTNIHIHIFQLVTVL
jgi:hypothetical protein